MQYNRLPAVRALDFTPTVMFRLTLAMFSHSFIPPKVEDGTDRQWAQTHCKAEGSCLFHTVTLFSNFHLTLCYRNIDCNHWLYWISGLSQCDVAHWFADYRFEASSLAFRPSLSCFLFIFEPEVTTFGEGGAGEKSGWRIKRGDTSQR